MKIVAMPVRMIAFFWPGNRPPRPYRFIVPDRDGNDKVIPVDQVIDAQRRKIAGIDSIVYECQSTVGNIEKRYQIKYLLNDCRWELYKI